MHSAARSRSSRTAFAEPFRASRPAPLQVVADSSRTDVQPAVQRVQGLLQQYAAEISILRLIMRGVRPAAMRPIAIEQTVTSFLVSSGTCLPASAILVPITTGLFRSERIIFGR